MVARVRQGADMGGRPAVSVAPPGGPTYHGDMSESGRKVLLAAPRGYCAGVDRAVVAVEKALDLYGAPVYVRKEIVHNRYVVDTLAARGAVFVSETDEVPEGATVVFSAHGVAPSVHEEAAERNLRTIDATCPLGHEGAQRGPPVRRRGLPDPAHRP